MDKFQKKMKKYLVHAVPFTDTQNVTIRFKIPIPLIMDTHGSIEKFLDFFGKFWEHFGTFFFFEVLGTVWEHFWEYFWRKMRIFFPIKKYVGTRYIF